MLRTRLAATTGQWMIHRFCDKKRREVSVFSSYDSYNTEDIWSIHTHLIIP